MFCTGAAPTVPGIRARFSSPGQPCCSVQPTKSCHVSPAPASTIQASARSCTSRRPRTSILTTSDSTSCVSTMLLPPPRMNFGARPNSGWSTTRRTSASLATRTRRRATAGRPKELYPLRLTSRSIGRVVGMAEFSPIPALHFFPYTMPSFDTVIEPNLVEVRNAVDQTNKEIGTRFDFKGSDARIELGDKEFTLYADSDFQLGQVMDILLAKLTKRQVDARFLDRSAKPEKIGGDKLKQRVVVKAGIDSDTAKKIQGLIKQSKMKVQAAIQGDVVRVSGTKRDDLQVAIALLKREVTDLPLSFTNFRE